MEKMQSAYVKKGFRVVSVMNDKKDALDKYIREKKSAMTFVADPDKTIRGKFGVQRVPMSFLVDKDGEVASITVQFSSNSLNQMSGQVATLVKMPAQVIAPQPIAACAG